MEPPPDDAYAAWGRAAEGNVRRLAEKLCAGDPEEADELVRAAENRARDTGPAAFLAWVKLRNRKPNAKTYCKYLLDLTTKECYGIWWRSAYTTIVGKAGSLLGQKDGAEDFAQDAIAAALAKPAHYFINRAHENSREGRKLDTPQKCFLGYVFGVLKRQAPRRRGQRIGAPRLGVPDDLLDDPVQHLDYRSKHGSPALADKADRFCAMLAERVQWDKETVADGIGRFQVFERLRVRRNRAADIAAEKGITEERVQELLKSATGVLGRWHSPKAAKFPDRAALPLVVWQLKKQSWFEEEAIKHRVGMFALLWYRLMDHMTLEQVAVETGISIAMIERRLGLTRKLKRDDERTVAQELQAQAIREGLDPEGFSWWMAQ